MIYQSILFICINQLGKWFSCQNSIY